MSAFTNGVKVMFAVGLFASALVACDDSTVGTGGTTSASTGTKAGTTTSTKASSGTMGTGGAGPACGLIVDSREDCQACIDGSCCAELQDCDPTTTSDCGKFTACLIACPEGDAACQDACVTADETAAMGAGLTAFQLIGDCFDQNCAGDPACVYPICESGLTLQDEGCAECLTTSCCNDVTACAADQGCVGCITNSMQDPEGPCGTAGSPSDMLFQAQAACETMNCKPKCTFSICGSDLGYSGFTECNACLSDNCCTSFDACLADMACEACLTGSGSNCDANTLFSAFKTCRDTPGATTCGDAGECN